MAEQGDANAQYNLGLLYALGQGVPQDFERAAEWYEKAAEQGVAAAQYNLGVIYANGQGVPQNVTEARQWFAQAAEQGVAQAEDSLGYFYGSGQGIPKNFAEAEKWYRRAAEKGIASAQFNLGVMYDLGQGVERDFAEALKWYRKAAAQGYAGAMTNIGILYYNAEGVKRDLVEAYAWFSRAEKAGDSRAGQLARIVQSRIQPRDLQRARELAANWKPEPPQAVEDEEGLFLRPATSTHCGFGRPLHPPGGRARPPCRSARPRLIRNEWTGVERTVAVGDVHGDFEQFVMVLESAGLLDGEGNWVGGRTHLVQTGDVLDRGPDSRKVMDLLMKLEKQAEAAGGRVHVLIGNHEAMNVYGDLRLRLAGRVRRLPRRDCRPVLLRGEAPQAEARPDARPQPVERRESARDGGAPRGAFAGGAVRQVDHRPQRGGEDRRYALRARRHQPEVRRVDARRRSMRRSATNCAIRSSFTEASSSTSRGRCGTADWPTATRRGSRRWWTACCGTFGVSRIVIGHSYTGGAVMPRFGGRVLMVDAGISRVYDNIGKVAALLVEEGKAWALHRGQKLELPKDNGPDLLRYLRQAAALDPKPSPLQARIAELASRLNTAAVK